MNRLVIATKATSVPMGAQVYEEEIARRADQALNAEGSNWQVDRLIVRSLRSTLPGTARLPMGRLARAGARERSVLGRVLYPKNANVHRMDLALPPARDEVVTMHDTVAWRFADEGTPPASAAEELRAAAAVICVSRYTAEDISEMFGVAEPHVVHLGVDDRFRAAAPLPATTREAMGIPARYVLHAGGASTRKNLAGLAGAWESMQDAHPDVALVLAGPPHPTRDGLFDHLPRVIRVGRVADEVLTGLMAGAEAVIVPSLHEGFGLPVLEAMATGAPVVVARTSSLVEVSGEAGILVEPTPVGIAEGVDYVLGQDFPRGSVVAAGREWSDRFTWERSAREHAAVWRHVFG